MKFAVRLVLGLLVLMLCGCATVQLNVTVRPDGTGVQETIVALDRQAYALMMSEGEDPLEEMQAEWESQGAKVTRYEESGKVGVRGITETENVGYFTWDTNIWQGRFDRKPGLFWTDYQLDLNSNLDLPQFKDEEAAMFTSQMQFQVTVTLPAEIANHNGELDATGRKVTWNLVPGTKENMVLKTRQYNWGRIAIIGLAILVSVGGAVLRQQQKKAAYQAMYPPPGGYAAPGQQPPPPNS